LSTRLFLFISKAIIDNKLLSTKNEKKDQVILIRWQATSYSSALIAYITNYNLIGRSDLEI
jgi:hypothetical protein